MNKRETANEFNRCFRRLSVAISTLGNDGYEDAVFKILQQLECVADYAEKKVKQLHPKAGEARTGTPV